MRKKTRTIIFQKQHYYLEYPYYNNSGYVFVDDKFAMLCSPITYWYIQCFEMI